MCVCEHVRETKKESLSLSLDFQNLSLGNCGIHNAVDGNMNVFLVYLFIRAIIDLVSS